MIEWRSRRWARVLPMSCHFSFPFSRPFQHSVNSLVCWLIMRRLSHFCTFIRFRTAWRVKIYRSISQMSSSHVSGTQVCPTRAMTTLVEFPTIFEVYPVRTSNSTLGLQPFLWVHCMRWGLLWKLPKRHSSFYTSFSICWLPSAFHYQSVVSLQFRKKTTQFYYYCIFHLSPLTRPTSPPPVPPPPTYSHISSAQIILLTIAFSSANISWPITHEHFIHWPATLFQSWLYTNWH